MVLFGGRFFFLFFSHFFPSFLSMHKPLGQERKGFSLMCAHVCWSPTPLRNSLFRNLREMRPRLREGQPRCQDLSFECKPCKLTPARLGAFSGLRILPVTISSTNLHCRRPSPPGRCFSPTWLAVYSCTCVMSENPVVYQTLGKLPPPPASSSLI